MRIRRFEQTEDTYTKCPTLYLKLRLRFALSTMQGVRVKFAFNHNQKEITKLPGTKTSFYYVITLCSMY